MTTGIWMDGGPVAEKTNHVINTLIREMNRQGAYSISVRDLNAVIQKVAGVNSDSTLRKYREHVGTHGPFTVNSGRFELAEEYRE